MTHKKLSVHILFLVKNNSHLIRDKYLLIIEEFQENIKSLLIKYVQRDKNKSQALQILKKLCVSGGIKTISIQYLIKKILSDSRQVKPN